MCFSMTSSFVAAGTLAATGIYAQKKALGTDKMFLAGIPLAFAVQQAAEGLVWIARESGAHVLLGTIGMYTFLFFAFVWWPAWIPFSFWYAENDNARLYPLRAVWLLGAIISIVGIFLLCFTPVNADIVNNSIQYTLGNDMLYPYSYFHLGAYVLAVVAPFFISSLPSAHHLGIAMVVAVVGSYILYFSTFISVWCFFAALVSLGVLVIVRRKAVH